MATKAKTSKRTRAVKTYGVSKRVRVPNPRAESRITIEHGRTRIINYGWLTDLGYGRRLKTHVKTENLYASDRFKKLGITKISKQIGKEIDKYLDTNLSNVVIADKDWSYYTILNQSVTAASHWRFPTSLDKSYSQLIFDEAAESERIGKDISLGGIQISDDRKLALITYCIDGSEKHILQVRDLKDGRIICECEGVSSDEETGNTPYFNSSSNGVVFVRRDQMDKDAYLCYREFSLTSKKGWKGREIALYVETQEEYSLSCSISRDLGWIMMGRISGNKTDVLLFDRNDLRKTPVRFTKDEIDFNYNLEIFRGRAFISSEMVQLSNGEVSRGEVNFYTIDLSTGIHDNNVELRSPSNWKTCFSLPKNTIFDAYLLYPTFTIFNCRVGGIPRVLIAKRDENGQHGEMFFIGNPSPLISQTLHNSPDDFDSTMFTVEENGMAPGSIYQVKIKSFSEETGLDYSYDCVYTSILEGMDPDKYSGQTFKAVASDGMAIPFILWTPTSLPIMGTVINVYGAYGDYYSPVYDPSFRSLLDHGVACAVAYVRGGGELGQGWHDAGKLENKMTTISDTLAVADKIKELGFAGVDGRNIVLQGSSAGGVAIGGALNLKPEAFAGVVGESPFVDCLSTMLDSTLPLTVSEYHEFGNPSISESTWDSIKVWSPVDNIPEDASHYPPVFATAGFNDPRVGVWEPARWVLTLRKSNAEAYLRTSLNGGHLGGINPEEKSKANAEVIAFILWCLTKNKVNPKKISKPLLR